MRTVAIDVPLDTTRAQIQDLVGDLVGKKPSTVNVQLQLEGNGYRFPYSRNSALIIRRVNVDAIAFDANAVLWKLKNPSKKLLPMHMRSATAQLNRRLIKAKKTNKPIVIRTGKK